MPDRHGLPAQLFLANAYVPSAFRLLLYGLVMMVGTLVGLEIPLVMRILRRDVVIKNLVPQVLTFDYLGALAVFGNRIVPPGQRSKIVRTVISLC